MNDLSSFLSGLETPLREKPIFPVEPRHKKPGDERAFQAAFRAVLRWRAPTINSWGVRNGDKRGPKAQRDAKQEGLTAGVFDEHYAANRWFAALEWKDGDGTLSQAQIDWGNAMARKGFHVACVRTPEFAERLFREWGAPIR